jgi:beta-lactamase superfamily II metal-dependent hydrolase
MRATLFSLSLLTATVAQSPQDALRIFFIDVEGGQATLLVSPSGRSMLIDAGYAGFEGRDAKRIVETARQAGVSRLDVLLVTHYHRDHVGGVPALAALLPVGTFADHGPTVEESETALPLYRSYLETRATGRHLLVKPGDTVPLDGVEVRVVSSAGEVLSQPLAGAGAPNPLCGTFGTEKDDPSENAQSVGVVIAFGRFRFLDLGDLTWNKERALACPDDRLGPVDLYVTTHHGLPSSGPPGLVHAVRPRAAVMNNGENKGGSREAWQIVRDSPGLLDIWQLHVSVNAGPTHNAALQFIANVDETTAHGINVVAQRDGSFEITNTRNGHSQKYPPRAGK